MFKIICDIKLPPLSAIQNIIYNKPVAPAVKYHGAFIAYKNCQPCDIVKMLPLSSTSNNISFSVLNKVIEVYNKNILSPVNKNYFDAYELIFDKISNNKLDPDNMKFIGIFANDIGLKNLAQTAAVEVFQTIIDASYRKSIISRDNYETGYSQYYQKYSIIKAANSTGSTFIVNGVMKQFTDNMSRTMKDPIKYSNDYYAIMSTAVGYLLRHQDALKCSPPRYEDSINLDSQEISQSIINYTYFIKQDIILRLYKVLSSARQYFTEDKLLLFFNQDESLDTSKLRTTLGRKLTSMKQTIVQVCAEKTAQTELLKNDFLTITCDNYESYISFDSDGEIANIESIHIKIPGEIKSKQLGDEELHVEL